MGLFRRNKSNDRPVIGQIIDLIPGRLLRSTVQKHRSDKYCHRYRTRDQLVALLFGQLCRCSTLEDISVGIGVSGTFIRDLGLEQSPAKSTMSDGNRKRDYRVFEALYTGLLGYYGGLLKRHSGCKVIDEVRNRTVLIRDSTVIALCLGLFEWAKFTSGATAWSDS